MCELLQVNRTSAYREPAQGEEGKPVAGDDEARMAVVDEARLELPASGARKMARERARRGLETTRYQATELMGRMNVKAVHPKPGTSKPARQHPKFPCLLRGMKIDRPGRVRATDITYIRMGRGHMCLACIIDWATRYVAGWGLPDTLEAAPVVEFMEAAFGEHGEPEELDLYFTSTGAPKASQQQSFVNDSLGHGNYFKTDRNYGILVTTYQRGAPAVEVTFPVNKVLGKAAGPTAKKENVRASWGADPDDASKLRGTVDLDGVDLGGGDVPSRVYKVWRQSDNELLLFSQKGRTLTVSDYEGNDGGVVSEEIGMMVSVKGPEEISGSGGDDANQFTFEMLSSDKATVLQTERTDENGNMWLSFEDSSGPTSAGTVRTGYVREVVPAAAEAYTVASLAAGAPQKASYPAYGQASAAQREDRSVVWAVRRADGNMVGYDPTVVPFTYKLVAVTSSGGAVSYKLDTSYGGETGVLVDTSAYTTFTRKEAGYSASVRRALFVNRTWRDYITIRDRDWSAVDGDAPNGTDKGIIRLTGNTGTATPASESWSSTSWRSNRMEPGGQATYTVSAPDGYRVTWVGVGEAGTPASQMTQVSFSGTTATLSFGKDYSAASAADGKLPTDRDWDIVVKTAAVPPATVTVKVDKKFTGAGTPETRAAGAYTFELWEGTTKLATATSPQLAGEAASTVSFPAITYSYSQANYDGGKYPISHTYTVREVKGSIKRVDYDTDDVTVTVYEGLDKTGDWKMTASAPQVTYGWVDPANQSLGRKDAVTNTWVNPHAGVRVKKVDAGTDEPLAGVTFEVEAIADGGDLPKGTKWTFTTGEDGIGGLDPKDAAEWLPVGKYRVRELPGPGGGGTYELADRTGEAGATATYSVDPAWAAGKEFEVTPETPDGSVFDYADGDAGLGVAADSADNPKHVPLPKTGGPGVAAACGAGLAAVAAGLALAWRRRRGQRG